YARFLPAAPRTVALSCPGGLLTRGKARGLARPSWRVPLPERRRGARLRGEGEVPPEPGALVLPAVGAASPPDRAARLRGGGPRDHRRGHRDGGADPRVEPDQAGAAALQRGAARRQELPVPEALPRGRVPAGLARAARP